MSGILDFLYNFSSQDPQSNPSLLAQNTNQGRIPNQGLLNAGNALLESSGYSTTPVTTGQLAARAINAYQQGNQQQQPDPVKLGQGDILVDPRTGRQIAKGNQNPNYNNYKVIGNVLYDMNTRKPVYTAPQNPATEPVVVVLDQNNRPVYVPKSQAIGMTAPTTAQKTRDLSPNEISKLAQDSRSYDSIARLKDTFKPEYSGNPIGAAENYLGRFGGEKAGITSEGQTQWWQDYQDYVNKIRNEQFGSALTATEKAEFLKAQVTPGMDPDQVSQNLARQNDILQSARGRVSGALRSGNYNQNQLDEIFGSDKKSQLKNKYGLE